MPGPSLSLDLPDLNSKLPTVWKVCPLVVSAHHSEWLSGLSISLAYYALIGSMTDLMTGHCLLGFYIRFSTSNNILDSKYLKTFLQ